MQVAAKRITIKDVASAADVAISTVSLVMNHKGSVSDDTRRKVLRVADKMGYVPTRAAQHLAAQRTGHIGFVLVGDHFERSEPFYTRVFLGAEFEAEKQEHYVLLATVARDYAAGQPLPRFMRSRDIDGLLVAGRVPEAFLEAAKALGVPVVLIDYESADLPAVVIDNQQGALEAVRHLASRGHTRIGFVGADTRHPSIRARLHGYRLGLAEAGLAADAAVVREARDERPVAATGERLAGELLALPEPPTALFCANDALALGALRAAQARGVAVPDDLALVGFDDIEAASFAHVPLTTVRVYKEQLGELALRYLHERIEHHGGGSEGDAAHFDRRAPVIRVPTDLIVRASS